MTNQKSVAEKAKLLSPQKDDSGCFLNKHNFHQLLPLTYLILLIHQFSVRINIILSKSDIWPLLVWPPSFEVSKGFLRMTLCLIKVNICDMQNLNLTALYKVRVWTSQIWTHRWTTHAQTQNQNKLRLCQVDSTKI